MHKTKLITCLTFVSALSLTTASLAEDVTTLQFQGAELCNYYDLGHRSITGPNLCTSMYAFCNSVETQRGKKLSDAEADQLVEAANGFIAALDEFAPLCE